MTKKIPVMEIFGPTIQGEGMVVGRKTVFLRTGGCDYSCAWCDSAFTWNGEQKAKMMTATEVYLEIMQLGIIKEYDKLGPNEPVPAVWHDRTNFNHVTISGGNPALIGEAMSELIDLLHSANIEVGLETQGSRWQPWFTKIDDLTISPKPPSSRMETNWGILDQVVSRLEEAGTNFTLKVVIFDDEDFEFAKYVERRYVPPVFYVSVGNVDAHEEGDISGRLLRSLDWLWEKVLKDPECNDWRPLPQLHTLVWANRRGV